MKKLLMLTTLLVAGCSDFKGAFDRCVADGLCVEEGKASVATSEATIESASGLVANGADAVRIKVVVRDLAGNPVANKGVRIASTGSGNTLVQPGTSDTQGIAEAVLTTTVAEAKTLSAFIVTEDGEAALRQEPWVTFKAGPVSPTRSTITVSPADVEADGMSTSTVTITLRDEHDNPIAGQFLSLSGSYGSPAKSTVVPQPMPTAATGVSEVQLTSAEARTLTLSASAEGTALQASPTVNFRLARASINNLNTTAGVVGGCVSVSYTLKQLQSQRTDLRISYAPDPTTSELMPATVASGPSSGLIKLRSSPDGVTHSFLWNSVADLGRSVKAGARLVFTPVVDGRPGDSVSFPLTVSNASTFTHERDSDFSGTEGVFKSAQTGDFNRDGKPDLAALFVNVLEDRIYLDVSTGDGEGGFRRAFRSNRLNDEGGQVRVHDFDRDGFDDVMVLGSSSLYFFRGTGDAGLLPSAPLQISLGAQTNDLEIGDLNRDGLMDIIAVQATLQRAVYLFGTGRATSSPAYFLAPLALQLGAAANRLALGDVNRDGRTDIVIADSQVQLLLSRGEFPAFGPLTPLAAGPTPFNPELVDLDGDGKLDILHTAQMTVAPQKTVRKLAILRGNGDGTFGAAEVKSLALTESSSAAEHFRVADVDGNGTPDIVVSQTTPAGLHVSTRLTDGTFSPLALQSVAGTPQSAVVMDADGDGKSDIAVLTDSGYVTLIRGRRPTCDSGFMAAASHIADPKPTWLDVADFDGDGKIDAVTNAVEKDSVTVLFGTGAGSMRRGPSLAVGDAPKLVLTGDFDSNGRPDIVAFSGTPPFDTVFYRGVGDGTFSLPQMLPLTTSENEIPQAAYAADLNGNGTPDIAVLTSDSTAGNGRLLILSGNGRGTFAQVAASTSIGAAPTSSATGDLDGDGTVELVVAGRTANATWMRTYRATPGGGFEANSISLPGLTSDVTGLAVADIDRDGDGDILGLSDTRVITVRNTPGGWVPDAFEYDPARVARTTSAALAVGDFNGDGKLDVAVGANAGSNPTYNLFILPGDGAGSFSNVAGQMQGFWLGDLPERIVSFDLEGNGTDDMLVVLAGSQNVAVVMGAKQQKGQMRRSMQVDVGGTVVADFNRDGRPDVLGSGRLALNDGVRSFAVTTPANLPTFEQATAGDLNRDGNMDVVTLSGSTLSFVAGNGNGGFSAPAAIPLIASSASMQLLSGDVDGDGRLDLLIPGAGNWGNPGLYRGSGNGTFTGTTLSPTMGPGQTFPGMWRAALGDLNRDGKLDIVAIDSAPGLRVTVYHGDGLGAFSASMSLSLQDEGSALLLADVDRNGQLEIAVATVDRVSRFGRVELFHFGAGAYLASSRVRVGRQPRALVAKDMNEDGLPDLAVSSEESAEISVLTSKVVAGVPTLTFEDAYAVGKAPRSLAVADFDMDGRPDLVTHVAGSNQSALLFAR